MAVGTEQRHHLPGSDLQAHPMEHAVFAVAALEVIHFKQRTRGPPGGAGALTATPRARPHGASGRHQSRDKR